MSEETTITSQIPDERQSVAQDIEEFYSIDSYQGLVDYFIKALQGKRRVKNYDWGYIKDNRYSEQLIDITLSGFIVINQYLNILEIENYPQFISIESRQLLTLLVPSCVLLDFARFLEDKELIVIHGVDTGCFLINNKTTKTETMYLNKYIMENGTEGGGTINLNDHHYGQGRKYLTQSIFYLYYVYNPESIYVDRDYMKKLTNNTTEILIVDPVFNRDTYLVDCVQSYINKYGEINFAV